MWLLRGCSFYATAISLFLPYAHHGFHTHEVNRRAPVSNPPGLSTATVYHKKVVCGPDPRYGIPIINHKLAHPVNTIYHHFMITTHYHTISHQPDLNRYVAEFVSVRIFGEPDAFSSYATMAIVKDGSIIGGVVFHEWQPRFGTVQLSAAGDHGRWLTRPVINAVFHFAYDMLGAKVSNANSPSNNPPSVRMNQIIYTNESVVKHMFGPNVHGHVFTMTAEEWKSSKLYKPAEMG